MIHSIYSDAAKRNKQPRIKLTAPTLLLDMDGTLLDLHFDNFFWQQLLPIEYAKAQKIAAKTAKQQLQNLITAELGTLNFYDVDYWSEILKLDLKKLKIAYRHKICLLAGSAEFLARTKNLQTFIITNAHPASLALKIDQIPELNTVDKIISAFAYGYCKEQREFWQALQADLNLNPQNCALVEDNLQVLKAAQNFGIGQLFFIAKPDSKQQKNSTKHDFVELNSLADLCL